MKITIESDTEISSLNIVFKNGSQIVTTNYDTPQATSSNVTMFSKSTEVVKAVAEPASTDLLQDIGQIAARDTNIDPDFVNQKF